MSENKKPTGPTPPDGYRWVPKGQIVWPTDCITLREMGRESSICAAACATDWMPAQLDCQWFRAKVTQPDLAWLKSKAVKHGEALTDLIEREKVRWQIAQAVRLYSEALMDLIPEQERYRPDQMREITVQVGDKQVTLGPGEAVPGEAYEQMLKGGAE